MGSLKVQTRIKDAIMFEFRTYESFQARQDLCCLNLEMSFEPTF